MVRVVSIRRSCSRSAVRRSGQASWIGDHRPTVLLLGIIMMACGRGTPPVPGEQSAAPSATTHLPERQQAILEAELSRDASRITAKDLSDRDVTIRRSAARALARIADVPSSRLLLTALPDEDPDVVAWAAYGLGYACEVDPEKTVRALVIRAASWELLEPKARGSMDVWAALAGGLARCATNRAEATLRAWLDGTPAGARAAAVALAQLAARRGRLDDASIVALLDAADRADQPLDEAFLAFGHLPSLAPSVRQRLLAAGKEALLAKGPRRSYALRCLGYAGPDASGLLRDVLTSRAGGVVDRIEAARQLGRAGAPGQAALSEALARVVPKEMKRDTLLASGFAPLAATLEQLRSAENSAHPTLERLAELSLPKDPKAVALRRRIVWLRCTAAALLAGSASLAPRLTACDPDPKGRQGRLARLSVLDRGDLKGDRRREWFELVAANDPVVAEAALRLIPNHPEIPRPHEALARALTREQDGVVATAAQIISQFPDRAGTRDDGHRAVPGDPATHEPAAPHPDIVAALTKAQQKKLPPDALQRQAAWVDAVGALELLSFKPQLRQACEGIYPTLREHAERALRRLGERRRRCPAPAHPPHVQLPPPTPTTELRLHTDIGLLTVEVDAQAAPQAAHRIVSLARAGFYNGTTFHRVVRGFVVQFGDRGGDGFGGAGKTPLRCETSPVPFDKNSVGLALSGRDTGSSQLFVVLGTYPHLDGDYTRLGRASGPWELLMAGDEIHRVEVHPR